MKDLTWKHVIIALGFLGCVAALAWKDADSGPVIIVGMAILAGLGWVGTKASEAKAETSAVREQTNGNTHKMLQMVESMANQMATMQPPAATVPEPEEKPSSEWPNATGGTT